jgi:alkanesulfonate monooxygenase SsuD/methylene tetrahydromethanopterin reductase-like flavin-dependent oxidoreductase (luciferase family)
MELGIYTFGEVPDGSAESARQRMHELLAEIELADQVGLDVFGLGEHHRAPINGRPVYPRPLQRPLPVWIAVGGTPASVVRAGRLGLPLAVAIIGGAWVGFAPLIDHYRAAAARVATTRRRWRSASTRPAISPTARSRPPTRASRT